MKEAGVLKCLTNALKLVDTDHPQVQLLQLACLCLAAELRPQLSLIHDLLHLQVLTFAS